VGPRADVSRSTCNIMIILYTLFIPRRLTPFHRPTMVHAVLMHVEAIELNLSGMANEDMMHS